MDLSIVIVNWNTRDLLVECISSVYKTVNNLTFEIWLVDNGSTDGSIEVMRRRFPDVKIIANKENLGFAKANNQALRQIKGRYAVLLNTDTVLTEGAIETIVEFMGNNKEIGICGGQLINADGAKQNSIANIPTIVTELLNKSLLRRLFPKKYPGKGQDVKYPIEVESVIGACMIVKKEAIDAVGLMDESYFFFLEETDWCLHMRKKGWRVFHHPGARIYHLQGQSAGGVNIRARVEYWKSRYIFFKKNYDSTIFNILRLGLLLRLFISFLMTLLLTIVSLFTYKRALEKLHLYTNLIVWHIKGLPEEYGLRVTK